MQLYAGLDLHSRNTYIGIMDQEFKRVFGKRVSNKLPMILKTLTPFQDQLKCGGGDVHKHINNSTRDEKKRDQIFKIDKI